MNDDDKERYRRRDERMAQMKKNMAALLADDNETPSLTSVHPLPWTWAVTYYDGIGIQFRDAAGSPVLPGLIYDEETAASVFKTITGQST